MLCSCANNQKHTNYNSATPITAVTTDNTPSDNNQEENSDSTEANADEATNAEPDEYGVYQGFPEEYKPQNKAEENLSASMKDYYKSLRDANGSSAAKYIAPKLIDIAQAKCPDMTRDQIRDEFVSILIGLSKDMNESLKNTFEGYETTITLPTKMDKVSQNGDNVVYSLEYAIVILCRYDEKNYVSWYMKDELYAGSKNNGASWYLIEPEDDYREIIADFK